MTFATPGRIMFAVFLTIVSHFAVAQTELNNTTIEGLQLIKDTNLALVYAQPEADMGRYKRIHLADASVAFKKNWKRNQNRSSSNRVTADEMSKIKAELALLFNDVFTKSLEDGGYKLVTETAEDVLLVKPAIINLDIVAPTTKAPGISFTYSETAGEMTLYLELYDSVTGDLIAKALDRRIDRWTGYFEWRNRVSNRAAARRILEAWAKVLKEGLDGVLGADPDINSGMGSGIRNP